MPPLALLDPASTANAQSTSRAITSRPFGWLRPKSPGAISGTDCISSTRTSTPLALLTAVRPRKPIRIASCRSDRWQVEVAAEAEQRAEPLHVPTDSTVRAAGLLRAGRERSAYPRT